MGLHLPRIAGHALNLAKRDFLAVVQQPHGEFHRDFFGAEDHSEINFARNDQPVAALAHVPQLIAIVVGWELCKVSFHLHLARHLHLTRRASAGGAIIYDRSRAA